jgi:hypothetical protein
MLKRMVPESPTELAISIVRFVDGYQPGIVACEFLDANGQSHTLVDKVPIFCTEDLHADSEYPQPAAVRCFILEGWRDTEGRNIVRITTDKPDAVESTDGLTEFVVLESQLLQNYSA